MKDMQFTQPKTMLIQPHVLGVASVQGLILYQKILVLMLSSSSSSYRENAGTQLIDLLSGSNTPSDQLLTSLGSNACAQARSLLDSQDIDKMDSLTASASNGVLSITLRLKDGQTYTGELS